MSLINAWLDLKKVLEFKKENLTPAENNILNSLHRECVKDFTACALDGCTAACIVAGVYSGVYLGRRSFYSFADQINAGTTWESDPLDRVFGYTQPLEDTIHSDSSNKQPSGTQNRVRRRSRRLRRMRNHDDLSNSEPTAAV
ncbi:hypothetical protein VIGAN_10239800 [Vigna angularis var. angularis]|uniref:Uncharacterized protein n=1 Tax=Vigna angularis var. angularis TaxID=157739 RepID=A0A0S3T6D3_PHAAN|nr:hypothetical protein VIGAN_10239800 [Vigna angularis var. angularis]